MMGKTGGLQRTDLVLTGTADGMSSIDSLAIHFIQQGQWAEAVELYREEFGLSSTQAEHRVIGLVHEHDLQHPRRLMSWLWIALGGMSILLFATIISRF
jgi:hypothetical protein